MRKQREIGYAKGQFHPAVSLLDLSLMNAAQNSALLSHLAGLFAVVILVALNGFFVAAEFALVSVRKSRIEELVNKGDRRARRVFQALEHLDTYIAATQLGITMASLALGAIGEPAVAHLVDPLFSFLPANARYFTAHGVAVAVSFSLVTALHIVFGELAPKSVALQKPDGTALFVTGPLNLFLAVFRPVILALNATGNFVTRRLGLETATEHGSVHSVEELELLVHTTREAGEIDEQQEQMVSGVFDFKDTIVRKVMTPRPDITAIDVDTPTDEILRVVSASGHSRLPVYEDNLDNIIGVIHVKDVLHDVADGSMDASVRALMRPALFVPESKRGSFLLAELRRQKIPLAVVRDEYGVVSGVVTIEDLIEEIVGDILDEYDLEEETLTRVADGVWLVEGSVLLENLSEPLEVEFPTDEADTIGGFVFSLSGHQPEQGESVEFPPYRLIVEQTDGKRVQKVRIERVDQPSRATPHE